MIVVKGFCDESGTEGDAKILVVAGALAPAERWERFEVAWKLVLASHDVPYFRAQEFYKHKKHFRLGTKWDSQSTRDYFIQQLLQVIQANETAPSAAVVSLVWLNDYRDLSSRNRRVRAYLGTAYTVGCNGAWLMGAKWAEGTHHAEGIAWFFDIGHPHARDALQSFHRATAHPQYQEKFHLGGLTFDDDQKLVPLQAADLLAYGITQSLRTQANWRGIDPVIRQYTANRFMPYLLIADRDYLSQMFEEHERQLRARGKKV